MKNKSAQHPSVKRLIWQFLGQDYILNGANYKKALAVYNEKKANKLEPQLLNPAFEGNELVTVAKKEYILSYRNKLGTNYIRRLELGDSDRMARRYLNDKKYAEQIKKSFTPFIRSIKELESFRSGLTVKVALYGKLLGAKLKNIKCPNPKNVRLLTIGKLGCRNHGVQIHKYGRDWKIKPAYKNKLIRKHCVSTRYNYTPAVCHNMVKSYVIFLNRLNIIININDHIHKLNLSKHPGYKWDLDDIGIKLVNGKDEYHFTADDIPFDKDRIIPHLKDILHEKRETRRKLELELEIENQDAKDVFVTFQDSIRAGNCFAGTKHFIHQNNLDPKGHYSIEKLLSLKIDNMARLKLVIKAAIKRHAQEMAVGYSSLDYHRNDNQLSMVA